MQTDLKNDQNRYTANSAIRSMRQRKQYLEPGGGKPWDRMFCPECGGELYPVAEGYEKNARTFFVECQNKGREHALGRKWKLTPRDRLPRPGSQSASKEDTPP